MFGSLFVYLFFLLIYHLVIFKYILAIISCLKVIKGYLCGFIDCEIESLDLHCD